MRGHPTHGIYYDLSLVSSCQCQQEERTEMITAIILSLLPVWIGVSSLTAEQFPAGIDPRLCPNYPQCDNAILAAFSKYPLPFMKQERNSRGGQGEALPEFDHFFFTQPGYPVGLSRIQCPNYPFCQ